MNSRSRRRGRTGSQRTRLSRPTQSQNRAGTMRRSFRKTTSRSTNKKSLNERRRLKIFNLNKKISNSDLKNLFSPYGDLVRCGIHFNKMGESTGRADIEFSSHDECENAINKLDNADIEGVKMRVKYADFGPRTTNRRVGTLSNRRRVARDLNRENRRNKLGGKRMARKPRQKEGRTSTSIRSTRRRSTFRTTLGRKKK